ncbi:MAG: RNA polymerase sigma factor [Anaerolineaceae bacterium]|nr:RNA polymerase sigma factor [Anaerolineaceae bacterium]
MTDFNAGSQDERLALKQLRMKDLTGLDYFIQKDGPKALAAAYLILRDENDAQDMVENSFVQACEKINQLKSNHFSAWFYRIVINNTLQQAKRSSRQVCFSELTPDLLGSAETIEEIFQTHEPALEDQLEIKQELEKLDCLLSMLSPQQRAVIVLRHYLEYSENEIAELLSKPKSSIKWHLFDGRNKLRKWREK